MYFLQTKIIHWPGTLQRICTHCSLDAGSRDKISICWINNKNLILFTIIAQCQEVMQICAHVIPLHCGNVWGVTPLFGFRVIWSHPESSEDHQESFGGHLESSRVIRRSSGVIQSCLEVIWSHPELSVGHLKSCRVIQDHPESSVGHLESSRVIWRSSGVIQSHL